MCRPVGRQERQGPATVRVICSLSVPAGATVPDQPVTVHLEILDVSLADAPATSVARVDVVVTGPGELAGPYGIDAGLTPGRQYAVSAHVDCSGDGSIAPGRPAHHHPGGGPGRRRHGCCSTCR